MLKKQYKILIATPVHESADYSIEGFLRVVKEEGSDSDLCLVDSSSNSQYKDRLKVLCGASGITNFTIIHLDLDIQDNGNFQHDRANHEERLAYSREELRKIFLKGKDYTHMFFWESDIILPTGALDKLMEFDDQFDVIMHDYPSKDDPIVEAWGFGCTIIKRKWFEKFSFLYDLKEGERYHSGEHRVLKKIRLAGGHWIELHNLLDIKHTNI